MPKFRPVQQQTIASAPRVSGDVFGASTGQAVQQFGGAVSGIGDQLAEVELRARNRADVIDRVRQQNAFDQSALGLREEFMAGEDITSSDAVERFRGALQKQKDQILSQHQGLPGSKDSLRASLENLQGQYVKQIMGDQIRAQQRLLLDNTTEKTNQLASITAAAPDALDDSLAEMGDYIGELAPALTEDQQREYLRAGQEQILMSAATNYLQKGDYTSANKILNDPNHVKVLSPQVARKMRMESVKAEAEYVAKEQAYNDRVAQYTTLTQRDLSPIEKERIRLLPDKPSEMTVADKIAEYEIVTGEAASQAVVDSFYKVTDTGRFGNSLRGRALQTVNEGMQSYSSGTLSEQEADEFVSAVYEAYGVKEYTDPVTGQRRQSQPSMPPAVKEALERGANTYGPVNVGGMAETKAGSMEMEPFEGESLWDLSDEVSGPLTGAQRQIFEMTGMGSPVQQKAASTATWLRENIVAGIRPEGRIADQYRQELMKLVDIQPKLLQNDLAYKYELANIDTKLRDRLKELRSISDGERSDYTLQDRRDALTLSHRITGALARLRVPRPTTPEEARALGPGTYFVDPRGQIGRVPVAPPNPTKERNDERRATR